MMAHSHNIPVLVCCETYKFHERVQMDSICFNELGDPEALTSTGAEGGDDAKHSTTGLSDWREHKNLKLLNLVGVCLSSTFLAALCTI